MTTSASMLDVALSYQAAGRSVVPIAPGSKKPSYFNATTGVVEDLPWKKLQQRPADPGMLQVMFAHSPLGIGIVCGPVSGYQIGGVPHALEVIDVDDAEVLGEFIEAANWQGLAEVLQRLLHQRTPGGAGHFAYLCAEWAGNTILARRPGGPDEPPAVALIETRGSGGQVVSAPTPPGIHPEHPERGYELVRGAWEDVPIITTAERQALLELARSFNTYVDTKQVRDPKGPLVAGAGGTRPGDQLNTSADRGWWRDILEAHGWALVYQRDDIDYWQRPGKEGKAWSATLGACGAYFYVFSSNAAPFEQSRAYSPFSAYALLDHSGDFKAAAKALAPPRQRRNGQHRTPSETESSDEQDDATPQESEGGPQPSQATRLVELVLDAGAVLFHTPDGEAYGTLPRDGHNETYPLKVRSFRRWMARLYYDKEGKSPGSQAVQDALAVLEGKAQFDGPELQVYVRLAEHEGKFYLDLANKDWQAVEVTTTGWSVVTVYPVKFRRMPGMLPLPVPVKDGNLKQLRALLNLNQPEQENDWRLVVHWLLANLSPRGPFPILVLHGGHGSGKTTLVRVLRSCVDPNTAPLRRPPRDDQNVAIAASNSWVVAYDNLSHLPDWLSDVLCCVATGLGFATRSLYTDGEEALFQAMRPVVVNGIEELASRADFLDRSIIVHLPAMQTVQDEQTFWATVEEARPKILGALLGIVSAGLKALPTTKLTDAPRMADFARWSAACAAACGWTADEFLNAYKDVRENTHLLTLEASLLWTPLQALVEDQAKMPPGKRSWKGTTTELLAALATRIEEETRRNKKWPKQPHFLSNDLRRLAPTLKAVGMTVLMTRDREGSHIEILEWVGKTASPASPASPASNDVPF